MHVYRALALAVLVIAHLGAGHKLRGGNRRRNSDMAGAAARLASCRGRSDRMIATCIANALPGPRREPSSPIGKAECDTLYELDIDDVVRFKMPNKKDCDVSFLPKRATDLVRLECNEFKLKGCNKESLHVTGVEEDQIHCGREFSEMTSSALVLQYSRDSAEKYRSSELKCKIRAVPADDVEPVTSEEGRQYWIDIAQKELEDALNFPPNWGNAKNVILFLGDGMGITVNTAARIYKGQKNGKRGEEGYLTWERFTNAGLLKTYNVNRQVPDSAGTATAYLTGIKANYATIGVDQSVEEYDCEAGLDPASHAPSILHWAQDAGKASGVVTTTRITHATPASSYAHSASRKWECDGKLAEAQALGCKDIAHQLVHELPGKNFKVILGGGRQMLGAELEPEEGLCTRLDGRNLTQEWLDDKTSRRSGRATAKYVTSASELENVDIDDTDFLMGLFGAGHVPYEVDRVSDGLDTPTIKQMTLAAIRMLQKEENGFVLLVEGGRIDHALHAGRPLRALEEAVAMDDAVAAALEEVDLDETLVVVTADHSHVMTMGGYPGRGNDILGLQAPEGGMPDREPADDGIPYTTLMFSNGPGYNFTVKDGQVARHDPSTVDTRDKDYRPNTALPVPDETHGGQDVAVWAIGPMSHLFHRTHEQHYVAHAVAYAACMGPSLDDCDRPSEDARAGRRRHRLKRRVQQRSVRPQAEALASDDKHQPRKPFVVTYYDKMHELH